MKRLLSCCILALLAGCFQKDKKQNISLSTIENELQRVRQYRHALTMPFLENYAEIAKAAQPGSTTQKIAEQNMQDIMDIRSRMEQEKIEIPEQPLTAEQARLELIRINQDRLILLQVFEEHYNRIVTECQKSQSTTTCTQLHLQKSQAHADWYKKTIDRMKEEIKELQK